MEAGVRQAGHQSPGHGRVLQGEGDQSGFSVDPGLDGTAEPTAIMDIKF